jgi:hypothetical protein
MTWSGGDVFYPANPTRASIMLCMILALMSQISPQEHRRKISNTLDVTVYKRQYQRHPIPF